MCKQWLQIYQSPSYKVDRRGETAWSVLTINTMQLGYTVRILTRNDPRMDSSRFVIASIGTAAWTPPLPTCTSTPRRFKSHIPVWIHDSAPEHSKTMSIASGPYSSSLNLSRMIPAFQVSQTPRLYQFDTHVSFGVGCPFLLRLYRRRDVYVRGCVLLGESRSVGVDIDPDDPPRSERPRNAHHSAPFSYRQPS